MIISLLLLGILLPYLTLTAYVNVGIVNGTEAKPHSRPYMVSVQIHGKHICGGFLVSKQFVMTAAHCFKDRGTGDSIGVRMTVVVGAHNPNSGSSRINVKFYHIHPGYDSATLQNDIMLLQLNETAKKSKMVNWIPIPKKDKVIKVKSKCSVAGWGRQSTNGIPSDRLMEVDVTITECQKNWKNDFYPKSMVCAGGRGGFCQGDSGGPLVCDKTAVGVVSFNQEKNCDSPTLPNVYTKISMFLTWINAILGGVTQELDNY